MSLLCEIACALLSLGAFSLMATTGEPGSAEGWIEVKGQRTALTHAFASMSEDTIEKGKERIEVILSDKPVPVELRKATDAWSFWAAGEAQKGALNGIIVYITPDAKIWTRGQRLTANGMEFYSQSSTSPESQNLVFEPAAAGVGEVAGKVWMKTAMRAVEESEGPWQVEVKFRTPVIARPAVTANLTGAAALNSPQYKAVQAHVEACRKRDMAAIRKTLHPNGLSILDQFVAARGEKAVLDMFAGEAAELHGLKPTSVTVRGDSAEVKFSSGTKESSSEHTMRLALDNGVWKIGQ
ncbi:MAG: hypothetical protein LLG20_01300 [Acidobacteriales bacterium]|nr:hypothetical protein [Terriglobales bacterium]